MTFIYNSEVNEFGFNSSGKVTVNGTADSTSSGVTSMLYWAHQVWYYNGTNWYHKSLAADSWTGPTTDPRSSLTESSQGDTVTDTTHFLYNSALDKWGINSSAQVTVNGTADTSTSSVQYLLYYSHRVYQYNGANFYYKALAGDSWTGPTTDPRPAQPTESAQGTTVSDTTTFIYNTALDKWGLNSSSQVTVNGTADTTTSSVSLLLYYNHKVYQENSAGNWWSKSIASDTWTATTDPRTSATGVQAFSADSVVDGVGVVTSFQRPDYYNYSGLATLLGQSGIRYVRADGQADNSNNFQTTLKSLFTTYGIKFHFTCGIQSSATGTVNNLAQYPAGMIKSIGGQNEPNSSNITAACDWNKALYQACKANSTLANIPVATMGFVTANAESNTAAAYPINSYCDIIDIHDYWGNQNPDKNTSGGNSFPSMWTALTSKISTTKASVYGESGTNSNTPYSASNHSGNGIWCDERTEGIQIVRYYMLRARSNSAQTPSICYRYEFKSEQSTNDLREGNFGIVEQDGTTVKPSYTALKNMISLLKDPGSSFTLGKFDFTLSGSTTNVQTMVMQKRDGSFIVAVWNNSDLFVDSTGQVLSLPAAQSVTITLNSGASAFQHYQTASPNSTGSWSTSTAIASNRQVSVQANSQVLFVLFVTT